MPRYARDYDRHYADWYESMPPTPWGGHYPPASYGGGPWYGLAGGGWAPYLPYSPYGAYERGWRGYDYRTPRREPEHSPAYGRGGDRELREWARRHGYDVGYAIRPRRHGRRRYGYDWR